MKRFIDLREQGTGYRFAWFDTTTDTFETFDGEQVWDTWREFIEVCNKNKLMRYRNLVPGWVFREATREEIEN